MKTTYCLMLASLMFMFIACGDKNGKNEGYKISFSIQNGSAHNADADKTHAMIYVGATDETEGTPISLASQNYNADVSLILPATIEDKNLSTLSNDLGDISGLNITNPDAKTTTVTFQTFKDEMLSDNLIYMFDTTTIDFTTATMHMKVYLGIYVYCDRSTKISGDLQETIEVTDSIKVPATMSAEINFAKGYNKVFMSQTVSMSITGAITAVSTMSTTESDMSKQFCKWRWSRDVMDEENEEPTASMPANKQDYQKALAILQKIKSANLINKLKIKR